MSQPDDEMLSRMLKDQIPPRDGTFPEQAAGSQPTAAASPTPQPQRWWLIIAAALLGFLLVAVLLWYGVVQPMVRDAEPAYQQPTPSIALPPTVTPAAP